MRIFLLVHVFFFFFLSSAQDFEALLKSEREAFTAKQDFHSKRSGQEYDVVYQHLKLKVIPDVRSISGSVVTRIKTLESNFTQFALDLDNRMIVDSVKRGNQSLFYSRGSDDVAITVLSTALNQIIEVEIFYHGDPTENEQKGFTFDWHQTGPIAWTLSQPYGAYGWWPNKQGLNDKIDSLDMSIDVPIWAKSSGMGSLVSIDTVRTPGVDTLLRFNWQHRYPIAPYLVAIVVANFYESSHYIELSGGDSVLHTDYMYPEYKEVADSLGGNIDGMMVLFDSLFGPYPFKDEKYGHALFGRGGGMEHQTMSSMSSLKYDLMAHELAHQWYGDKITCGSWQDLWLNEGFATYSVSIAKEFLRSHEEWLEYITTAREKATSQDWGTVYIEDEDTLDMQILFSGNITYRKAAMVLQTLRWEIGDDAFFEGLREYTKDQALCFDFAKTADFIYYMEQSSGQDLTAFFDRYVYKEGHPIVETIWTRKGGNAVHLNVKQTTSHPSVVFYPLRIQYQFIGENRDTIIAVSPSSNDEEFVVDVGFKVNSVVFDPNVWLISKFSILEGNHSDFGDYILYPNPCNTQVTIFIKDQPVNRVEIYDILSRPVEAFDIPVPTQNRIELDLSTLKNGRYFIRLFKDDEQVSFDQFVKIKD